MNKANTILLDNIDKLHTTELGIARIKRNLELETNDVTAWCKTAIKNASEIYRKGKNWYAAGKGFLITVNAHSYTIITAHRSL